MTHKTELAARIPGWGADLKPENRPGVPMQKAPPAEGTGAHWTEPERQSPQFPVFKTSARKDLTPVFGATCPPKGLSGILRGAAYKLPESHIKRWVILLMADRIDVIETIASDVIHGRAGNPIRQTGVLVELKERGQFSRVQRKRLTIGLGIGASAIGLGVAAMLLGRKHAQKSSAKRRGNSRLRAA